MSRYIDADKVIQILNDSMCTFPDCYVAENIEQLPTIDIVLCGECRWHDDIGCALRIVDDSDKPKDEDFCSFGEREGE